MDDIGATVPARAGGRQWRRHRAARCPDSVTPSATLKQFVRRQVRDDEAVMVMRRIGGHRSDIVVLFELYFRQREMLVEKLAGGVVVLGLRGVRTAKPSLSAGCATANDNVDFDPGMVKIADADLDGFGRERMSGHNA